MPIMPLERVLEVLRHGVLDNRMREPLLSLIEEQAKRIEELEGRLAESPVATKHNG